jgi:LPXTG-motif cell wall-anchored protein
MDNTTLIRTIAGTCFFIVLAFLVLRRRKKLN